MLAPALLRALALAVLAAVSPIDLPPAAPSPGPPCAHVVNDLPAVSADLRSVALVVTGPGPAVYSDFAVLDADRDVLTDRTTIQEPDGDRNEDLANARLATRCFAPIEPLDVDEDPTAPVREGMMTGPFRNQRVRGHGVVVTFHEPILRVADEQGRTLLRRDERRWSKPEAKHCPGCPICAPPLADIGGAWIVERRLLLVRVVYHGGTDSCWEPGEEYHAIRLR